MDSHDIVTQWIAKSTDDLDNAKFLCENKWPRPLELVCYLCQQSGEKALKAYIIYNDEEPPYTHDLGMLFQICAKFTDRLTSIVNDSLRLTSYSSQTRYPNDVEIEEHETEFALKQAEIILSLCTELIAPPLAEETDDATKTSNGNTER